MPKCRTAPPVAKAGATLKKDQICGWWMDVTMPLPVRLAQLRLLIYMVDGFFFSSIDVTLVTFSGKAMLACFLGAKTAEQANNSPLTDQGQCFNDVPLLLF